MLLGFFGGGTIASGTHPTVSDEPAEASELILGRIDGVGVRLVDARLRRGADDLSFADPAYDDSAWESRSVVRGGMPAREGVYWVRLHLRFDGEMNPRETPVVRIATVCAYEFYFDGTFVGHSGEVGASVEEEIPGLLDVMHTLPADRLASGPHVLAFRVSSFHDTFPSDDFALVVNFGAQDYFFEWRTWRAAFPLMAACLAALAAVSAALFANLTRDPRTMWNFAILSLIVTVMEGVNGWRWITSYPYPWHYPRLVAITALTHFACAFLVFSLQRRFHGGSSKIVNSLLVILAALVWVLPESYLGRAWLLVLGHFVISLGVLGVAALRRTKGVIAPLMGLVLSLAIMLQSASRFLEQGVFLVFLFLVVILFGDLAFEMRRERRRRQAAVVTSARLEAEFAKRYLQPHFLLNTLAVLQESIETSPADASRMIDSLGTEVRQLGRMIGEELVPLDDELALCRAHLDIMSHRLGQSCRLVVEGDHKASWKVPPAILHTLIENAFTHHRTTRDAMEFRLSIVREGNRLRLSLNAPGAPRASSGVAPTTGSGQGTRYLHARLEESFPGQWQFEAAPAPDERWTTHLLFPLVS